MHSCPLPHIVTMIKIYVYSSLLSALSIVEMKPLNINGRVGESVEIKCSDWDSWTNVTSNVKYFCRSPCTEDKHIIIKAAYRKYIFKGRIQLNNIAEGLFVTFTNLQKSDSGTYYCGAERIDLLDSYIEVNLKVTDAESSSPKTTPETIIIHSTASFATNSSTMSSDFSDVIADTSVSYTINSTTTTTSATQGAGSVPYVITCFIVIPTILMVLLMLMRKMRRKHLRVEEDTQESSQNPAGPDGVSQSLHPLRMDEEQVYSTLEITSRKVSSRSAVPDGVYQSLAPLTKDDDQVYDTLKPAERVKHSRQLCHNFE